MSFAGFTDTTQEQTITNDGWFPDIALADFQAAYRVPAEFESETLIRHLALAMAWANRQLATWQAAQETTGVTALGNVSAPAINGESSLVTQYKHAVCCRAKGQLLWEFRPLSQSRSVKSTLDDTDDTTAAAGIWQQYAEAALAEIQGQDVTAVRLI